MNHEQAPATHANIDSSAVIQSSKLSAIVFGVAGQDGSYLAELLLSKDYEVHGVTRRTSNVNALSRLEDVLNEDNFKLHFIDVEDPSGVFRLMCDVQPREVYNLAALSDVKISFATPVCCANVNAVGTLNLLEALRNAGLQQTTRFYQASTSELYGKVSAIPQNENTPFHPRSPYAVSKLMAYWSVVNYREAHGVFACNGILFNHESPRRGENFVTRKITIGVAQIYLGAQQVLVLGNLDAKRDWGHAQEYVEVMWKILQHSHADDFVIGTGKTNSVREFCKLAFKVIGMDITWKGTGVDEIGSQSSTGRKLISLDPSFYRPAEVDLLLADPTKARTLLGWNPSTSLDSLVREMVYEDIKRLEWQRSRSTFKSTIDVTAM